MDCPLYIWEMCCVHSEWSLRLFRGTNRKYIFESDKELAQVSKETDNS